MLILSPNRDLTFIKPGSRFGEAYFSHINISSCFAGMFLFIKCMCNIFKDCSKTFNEKHDQNKSQ